MFINEDIVAVAFRFINFITVIGLGLFLFKKYILPDMSYLISQQKSDRDALFTQQAALEEKQFALDALLKEESLHCELLKLKVDEWKKTVELECERREKQHHENMATLSKEVVKRTIHKEQTRVQNAVINAVVPELQKSLSDHFENEHQGEEYLNSIILFMSEKT